MVTNEPNARDPGRPRTFTDDDIFAATARAVARLGYARLTVEAVAAEVGCTGPALIRRFGTKRGLLLAYLARANEASIERFRWARRAHASPLEALRARFRIPTDSRLDEVAPPAAYVNMIFFHLAAWTDPELRPAEQERQELFEREIAALLAAASDAGELAGCDPERLGRTLLATLTGTALQWASNPDRQIEDRLEEAVNEIVAPYRVSGTALSSQVLHTH